MLNFTSILLGSDNPQALAEFYEKVLEKEPDWGGEEWFGFAVGTGFITIGPHDMVSGKSTNPERIIINFESDDVESEFERIEALGAEVIAKPYSMDENGKNLIATFADLDGNYFQLMSPWEVEMDYSKN